MLSVFCALVAVLQGGYVRNNLFRLAFSLCLPLALPAGTLTLAAYCPPDYLGNSPSCISPQGSPFGSASASGGPFSVNASGFGQGYAIASSVTDVLIEFTGGTGAAFYLPCLSVNYTPFAMASALLAGVGTNSNFIGSCTDPPFRDLKIPFVFGVPQIQGLSLFAEGGYGGSASAVFSGVLVLDSNNNVIPGASASIQETPEPTTGATVLCGLALALIVRPFLVRSSH
jgi:hypothetical protein